MNTFENPCQNTFTLCTQAISFKKHRERRLTKMEFFSLPIFKKQESSSGLSTEAKIGIGTGLASLVVTVIGVLIAWRQWRQGHRGETPKAWRCCIVLNFSFWIQVCTSETGLQEPLLREKHEYLCANLGLSHAGARHQERKSNRVIWRSRVILFRPFWV